MPCLFLAVSKRNACAYYGIPGTGSLIKLLNCSHRISSAFGWPFKKPAFTLSWYCQKSFIVWYWFDFLLHTTLIMITEIVVTYSDIFNVHYNDEEDEDGFTRMQNIYKWWEFRISLRILQLLCHTWWIYFNSMITI